MTHTAFYRKIYHGLLLIPILLWGIFYKFNVWVVRYTPEYIFFWAYHVSPSSSLPRLSGGALPLCEL